MIGKIVASVVSLVLVVGVVIGVVAVVHRNNDDDGGTPTLSTSTKNVEKMCAPTDYKELCRKSLSNVNDTEDPKEYIKAAILATADAAKKAFNLSDDLLAKVNTSNPDTKMALEDCKDLLQDAIAELQASFSSVGDSRLHTLDQRAAELQNWLSAVISYQQTCLDQFDGNETFKISMKDGMLDAGQLTSNALAIVGQLAHILDSLGIDVNLQGLNSGSRRLLSVGSDGYPTWFSNANRRLLASQNSGTITPNATVAQDGSGQYKTIAEALTAYTPPKKGAVGGAPYIVYVKAGIYKEYVTVDKKQLNVFMYGDGPSKTIITGNRSNRTGYKTMKSGTFEALGDGFVAKSMAFENTAGPEGHQAVALRVQSDKAIFIDCRIDGYQDTLYAQTHRQFYNNCTISGTVDFIFGDSSVVIQNSVIVVRRPMDNQQNTVTAHGRVDRHETTGLVLQNCKIIAEDKLYPDRLKFQSYLGRPWKAYSRAIIMESDISDVINATGWMPWSGNLYLDTLYFAEYGNTGIGANTAQRVNWKGFHVLKNKNDVLQFTAGQFLQADQWLNQSATLGSFSLGLTH